MGSTVVILLSSMVIPISLFEDLNKWSSSSPTLSKLIFGIFENGIFFESLAGTRTWQTAQVTSAKTDIDICCKNSCKRVSFKSRGIGSGQGGRMENRISTSSCSKAIFVCFCFSSFFLVLFVWFRFFCCSSRICLSSSVSFDRLNRICSLFFSSRIWLCFSVSLIRSDRICSLFFSSRICRCSCVSVILFDLLRSLCFSSRIWRCSSVSFVRVNLVCSLFFSSRACRCSSGSFVRFDRFRSRLFSSRICRCSSVSFALLDRDRSLCFSSRRWRCSSLSFVVFSFEFGIDGWLMLSSMVPSLRKRLLGEDWNSGILIWVIVLFLNVLFSGV